jgi:hypothetical protein
LITPVIADGPRNRIVGPVTLGILKDLGWEINLPEITIQSSEVVEGDVETVNEDRIKTTNVVLTVELSRASSEVITLQYKTIDGTLQNDNTSDNIAKGGFISWLFGTRDYKRPKGSEKTITFQPEDTSEEITIEVLRDGEIEADEAFQIQLFNPQNALISKEVLSNGIVTIQNDDAESSEASSEGTNTNRVGNSANRVLALAGNGGASFQALATDDSLSGINTLKNGLGAVLGNAGEVFQAIEDGIREIY